MRFLALGVPASVEAGGGLGEAFVGGVELGEEGFALEAGGVEVFFAQAEGFEQGAGGGEVCGERVQGGRERGEEGGGLGEDVLGVDERDDGRRREEG